MVSARLGVAARLLAGCDSVFGLREITLPADAPPEACPADYIAIVNGSTRYRFGDTKTQWPLAAADCRDDSITGITHLVVFDGAVELAAVRAAVPLVEPWAILVGYARDTDSDPYVFRAVTGDRTRTTASATASRRPRRSTSNDAQLLRARSRAHRRRAAVLVSSTRYRGDNADHGPTRAHCRVRVRDRGSRSGRY